MFNILSKLLFKMRVEFDTLFSIHLFPNHGRPRDKILEN